MAVIIKCAPTQPDDQGCWLVFAHPYKGARPNVGDQAYLWFSENQGGAGLHALGEIIAVGDQLPLALAVRSDGARLIRGLTNADLAPHRDETATPLGGLAGKLYRHALDKIAVLAEGEASYLATLFEAPIGVTAAGKKYDPLAGHLSRQGLTRVTMTFEEIEEVIGGPLPKSAQRPQFWANTKKTYTNVQREAWRKAGYKAFLLSGQSSVMFERYR